MLLDRLYTPKDDEIIYHYCTPTAFVQIIKARCVWFSDIYSMNDFLEMRWGYSIFEKAATILLKDVGKEFLDKLDEQISEAYNNLLLLVSCYSLDGDVLSQWRAYSDDGLGFSIGFSAKEMIGMPIKPLSVLYDESVQVDELVGNIRHTYDVEKANGFKYGEEFKTHWAQVALDLCAYKNPAFAEEKEVRLAHVAGLVREGKSKKIVAMGGTGWGRKHRGGEVQFRTSNELVVPYLALDYSNGRRSNPVREIVLGPRNENLPTNVEVFLNTLGMKDISIRRSKASYR